MGDMNSSDRLSVSDLLRRARGNDPHEMDRLFAACRNYLTVLARAQVESWLRAKVDASDLIQQTLLEAYRDFQRFRGATEAEWLAWLRQILTHNAANFVRQFRATGKRQLSRELSVERLQGDGSGPAPALIAPGASPSEEFVRQEQELLLADALAQLPEDYREVILLRNLQRLPFQEVAQRMDRSRPAVQMLWGRAIDKLQQIFGVMKRATVELP
jgi:RNA polymerase sigma-70 factor (ECF subfamily)